MILYKDKQFRTNSEHPNDDWVGDADYVLDDSSDLVKKILEYYPKFKIITDTINETDDEGNKIEKEIVTDIIIDENYTEEEINAIREAKRKEISIAGEKAIWVGVDVGDKHYSLTSGDQANILGSSPMAQAGKPVLYHADGEPCRLFTPEEFIEVANAATRFITQQRTYCNLLMQQLKTLTDVNEINAVTYGTTELTGEYADIYNTLINSLEIE